MSLNPRDTWNLQEQAEQLAAGLPPLLVDADRLAASVSLGVHGRRKAGMGENFWQFRRYGAGDPAPSIDWRQSAKSQHLFVREREWEAAQAVWFWRDNSATMQFQSQFTKQSKAERATVLMLALASLLLRGGERIALFGSERRPSSGRGSLGRIAQELSQPDTRVLPPNLPVSRNARMVWLSDFLSAPEEIGDTLRRLSEVNVSGQLVHIIDPAEEDFPFEGRTRFEALSGSGNELFGRAESVREAYRERFRAHGEAVATLGRRFGWAYQPHRTDNSPQLALLALYTAIGGEGARRIA